MQSKAPDYIKNYGVNFSFKAAVHKGTVVVGEMGVIKREIMYSGDILNTTARMLEQCKVNDQKLIVSQDVLAMIPQSMLNKVHTIPIREMVLRGKVQSVRLYGVNI